MRRLKGFTLIELMVVISIIVMLIGILLPSLSRARTTARRMQGMTQVRGVQQSMVTFAQGNNGRYPGRTSTNGVVAEADITFTGVGIDGDDVEGRFAIMLEEGLVPPELLVSPVDNNKIPYTGDGTTPMDGGGYSYSLLHIGAGGQRDVEWTDTTNSQAIVVGDRLVDVGADVGVAADIANYDSIYAEDGWEGNLGYNDNHVAYVQLGTVVATGLTTKYGTTTTSDEDPFDAASNNDGVLIGRGSGVVYNANVENP